MKPLRLKLHGFSRAYRSTEIEMDFEQLPDGVYAWCGPNGAGKTTAMGAIAACLYRLFPGYPYKAAQHVAAGVRDAFAELVFASGPSTYRTRLQCDPAFSGGRGKTEHYVDMLEADGTWRALAGPALKDADAVLARIVPPLDFWRAGPYAEQGGGGGFWKLSMTERKSILVELLGHGRLHELHARAQAARSELEDARDAWVRTVDAHDLAEAAVAEHDARLEELNAALRVTRAELEERQNLLALQHTELSRAREAERLVSESITGSSAIESRRAVLTDRVAEARSALADVERRVAAAAGAAPDLAAAETLAETARALAAEHRKAADAFADAEAAERAAVRELERDVAEMAASAAREERAAEAIRGVDVNHPMCRACPLTAAAIGAASVALATRAGEQAKREELEIARGTFAARAEAYQMAEAIAEESRRAYKDAFGALEELHRSVALRQADEQRAVTLRAKLNDALEEFGRLPEPDASLADRQAALELARARRIDLEAAAAAEARGIAELEGAVKCYERDVAVVMFAREQDAKKLHPMPREALTVKRLDAERRAAAAALLVRSFGPAGVQALELDQAAPMVSELANELLRVAYGPRFAIRLETLRPYKSREGMEEVFECVLVDSENDSTSHQGSGGEMVIAEEALRLALCIYSTQHAGVECRTLFRDEAAGALDQWPGTDQANRYLAMLRAARVHGGFSQVHFIAHQAALYSSADGRFTFERGTVRYDD